MSAIVLSTVSGTSSKLREPVFDIIIPKETEQQWFQEERRSFAIFFKAEIHLRD
jgi:hypothetical protein